MNKDELEQLRQVTASPSPLAELVSDPILFRTLTRSKSSRSRHSGRRSDGKKSSKDSASSSTVLSVVLAEEERQVQYLKSMLRSTTDRLQSEMRRADDAEANSLALQSREREALAKAVQAEQARHRAELEVSRQLEEIKRYRLQIGMMEGQIKQAQESVKNLEDQRDEAEEAAAKARGTARQYKQTLADWKAREEGREEGRRLGMLHGYSDGRVKGWQDGRLKGFEQGRVIGQREGRVEGESEGRAAARQRALRAFDRFASQNRLEDEDRRRTREPWRPKRTGDWAAESGDDDEDPIPIELSSPSSQSRVIPSYAE